MLELIDLAIRLPGGRPLLGPLSLRVGAGQVLSVMGPSGVGKSSLLDAIGGHLGAGFALQGSILLDGAT